MLAQLRAHALSLLRSPWAVLCASATLLKLWLVAAQTLSAIAPSPHDDQLFLSRAAAILGGRWLGGLNDLTLAKGPIYPLWLALNQLTGMRLLLSQALLSVLACAVLVRAVRPVLGSPWRRALLYLAVLFNPATWANGPATRLLRDGIYPALSMLVLGLAIGAALRLRETPRRAARWGAAAGFAGALTVMTREEGLWLAPALSIVVLVGLVDAWRPAWRVWMRVGGAVAVGYLLPTLTIASINGGRYGQFVTCETRAGYFQRAYGALTRVKTATWNPYVPVPAEARRKVAAVSPAFQEIAPHLERWAPKWTEPGCAALGVCDDIAGGWFMWAFRGAVMSAGEYRSGRKARAWYQRLAREVDQACRSGELDCLPARSSLMPPWRTAYLRPVASALRRGAVLVATFDGVTPISTPPQGDEPELAEYERVTHERLPRRLSRIQGVLTTGAGEVTATVVDHLGARVDASIQRVSAPVEGAAAKAGQAIRLDVTVRCTADCTLKLATADGRSLSVPIVDPAHAEGDPALAWTSARVERLPVDPPDPARQARLKALESITLPYARLVPALSLLAAAVLAWRLLRSAWTRTVPIRSLLALALLTAVVMRLLVLALIEATSFPAVNVLYMSPAYGLLVAFVALVLLTGREPNRTSPPAETRRRADDLPPVQA